MPHAVHRTGDPPVRAARRRTPGHAGRLTGRLQIQSWSRGLAAASIEYAIRHAHASWLLAGGADLQVVKERLAHGSISTTEKYLHTLPDADGTALDALARTRSRFRV
ncbi:hypothetical protein Pth03_45230 [Planotetraspora thailandica]|uniref:Tyr recombinase domain-containing protein n=1 Tax=Planotetraspora thailandica TaxID=487172 RepID=A0A8J3XX36_9ACTN|nr:tyrosine-type recombinase/integrase [Planotetraspora thailandica]GII56134.1 hypothetical protein Pth03_45230 [Planotetraspora thailandica]